jgi:hypothetical protein
VLVLLQGQDASKACQSLHGRLVPRQASGPAPFVQVTVSKGDAELGPARCGNCAAPICPVTNGATLVKNMSSDMPDGQHMLKSTRPASLQPNLPLAVAGGWLVWHGCVGDEPGDCCQDCTCRVMLWFKIWISIFILFVDVSSMITRPRRFSWPTYGNLPQAGRAAVTTASVSAVE